MNPFHYDPRHPFKTLFQRKEEEKEMQKSPTSQSKNLDCQELISEMSFKPSKQILNAGPGSKNSYESFLSNSNLLNIPSTSKPDEPNIFGNQVGNTIPNSKDLKTPGYQDGLNSCMRETV